MRPSVKESGAKASSEPTSTSAGRPPAAPPPRPLGRPLTVRPAWEEVLLDVRDGPIPVVTMATVLAFVVARVVSSGLVPWGVAIVAGVVAFAVFRSRRRA